MPKSEALENEIKKLIIELELENLAVFAGKLRS